MKAEEKKLIREIIEEKIIELNETITSLEEESQPVAPDNAYGRLSRMEAIASKAISDSGLQDKKATLQRLNFALSIIDSDNYGLCHKCHKEISFNRMIAIPYALHCINCA